MLIKHKVPKTIQWIIKLFIIYLFIFTSFRIATLVFFKPAGIGFGSIISSFFLGLKYDLRWIAIFLLPIACISLFPRFSPFYSDKAKKRWTIYLAIITLLVLFFFGVDFGHFAYVSTRLNANALNYTQDAKITAAVLWQSYPIIWILSGVVGALLMIAWIFKRLHVTVEEQNINIHKFSFRKRWHILTILVLGWFVYGFLTLTPLQWSSAFKLKSNFNSYLALNPFQNFISTLRFRKPAVEEDKARLYYSVIKKFLQLENTNHTNRNYQRIIYPGSNHIESRPNIVMVICENFSMYKSSMSGNSLNSTPYFNELRKQGIFFENCFSPTFGTARSVFSLLTGIPDVQLSKFSSRTEDSKNQVTVINNFEGYKKMYFIGGSSEFNNYKGILSNIKDINIYDEGDFTSPKLNVWGISDKNLFLEANKKMKEVGQPFFSIIQTSDNRRPFTIPTEDSDFVQRNITNPELKKYGFESLKEFNSFSYTDYCYKIFIETAKQSPYFENTIFVFIGDHGVEGNALSVYPKLWTEQRLTDAHVPWLIYSPSLIQPQTRSEVVSQLDVLPTIAGLLDMPYANQTLGRDLLDSKKKQDAAFIMQHDEGKIGLITNDFFYSRNLWMNKEEFISMKNSTVFLSPYKTDSIKKEMKTLTTAFYETAKWMLLNNRPK